MREPEVVAREAEIRGVRTRLRKVYVEGHLIEISLCYRISDAESAYDKTWDESLDEHLAMGIAAVNRIAADETLGKAVAAEPRVLDGICCRTAAIDRCEEAAPASHYWVAIKPDGTRIRRSPYSCVAGTPPLDHSLLREPTA